LGDSFTNLAGHQSDQIGRIFTHWVIIYFGQFFLMIEVARFGNTFFHEKGCALILTKMGWASFWVIFSQVHLVTLLVTLM
jgi:hypothetical protein